MKTLKKTLALIAALTMVATTFAACSDSNEDSDAATTTKAAAAADTTKAADAAGDETTAPADETTAPADAEPYSEGGAQFTVVSWNPNDFPALLATYIGKVDEVSASDAQVNVGLITDATTPHDAAINFVDLDCTSQESKQKYDTMLAGGEDIDLYAAEADFALDYIGDSNKALDFAEMGFSASDWKDAYGYTLEIGKDSSGALRGISWQACPGGYAYRTDLAEEYLGVTTPEAMQEKVKDWATMEATAATVYEASGKKTAMVDTLGGMWQVFQPARDTAWVVDGVLAADDKQSLKFLEMAKTWTDAGYVTKVTQWDKAWLPMGQDGATLGFFVSTWGFGDTILIGAAGGVDGKTYGDWGLVTGPQGFFWGGTWFIVNPATDNGDDAADFITALTLDEDTMAAYAKAKGEYMNNKKVMAQGAALANDDILANFGGQDYITALSVAADDIALDASKITKYDATIKADFITAVTGYVQKGEYADEAATIAGFKALVQEHLSDVTVS